VFRPSEVPPALDVALAAVRALPTSGAQNLSPAARASWLVGLQQLSDAVAASATQVLDPFDAAGDGETLHGARSTAAWLRGALRISSSDASKRVAIARASRQHLAPAVSQLASGAVTHEHVRSIDSLVRPLPEARVAEAAEYLTELSTHADVETVRRAGRYLQNVVDPDGSAEDSERRFRRRHLQLSPLLDGMVAVDGMLDPEGAATVNAALQPFLVPTDKTDDRTTSQRRADGLVDLARKAMDQGELGISGGTKPHLNVLCTYESLVTGQGAAELWQTPGGGVIGTSTLQRVTCDSSLARVLLNSDSVPVDLGRSQRLFTPNLRRLMELRDAGCRFPGCGMPPAFTDGHHITPWLSGGETNLTNGILLCRFHHRRLHEGSWTIQPASVAGANALLHFVKPYGPRLESRPRCATPTQLAMTRWWDLPPPDTS
jgi:Domain of unknown function (DUF222)/HNH endonuclease